MGTDHGLQANPFARAHGINPMAGTYVPNSTWVRNDGNKHIRSLTTASPAPNADQPAGAGNSGSCQAALDNSKHFPTQHLKTMVTPQIPSKTARKQRRIAAPDEDYSTPYKPPVVVPQVPECPAAAVSFEPPVASGAPIPADWPAAVSVASALLAGTKATATPSGQTKQAVKPDVVGDLGASFRALTAEFDGPYASAVPADIKAAMLAKPKRSGLSALVLVDSKPHVKRVYSSMYDEDFARLKPDENFLTCPAEDVHKLGHALHAWVRRNRLTGVAARLHKNDGHGKGMVFLVKVKS